MTNHGLYLLFGFIFVILAAAIGIPAALRADKAKKISLKTKIKCKHAAPGVKCDRCPWCWSVKCPGTL